MSEKRLGILGGMGPQLISKTLYRPSRGSNLMSRLEKPV